MANYKQQIAQAKTKDELKVITNKAFMFETSTTYNKVLNMCLAREKELENV